jgi:hypothetical protein
VQIAARLRRTRTDDAFGHARVRAQPLRGFAPLLHTELIHLALELAQNSSNSPGAAPSPGGPSVRSGFDLIQGNSLLEHVPWPRAPKQKRRLAEPRSSRFRRRRTPGGWRKDSASDSPTRACRRDRVTHVPCRSFAADHSSSGRIRRRGTSVAIHSDAGLSRDTRLPVSGFFAYRQFHNRNRCEAHRSESRCHAWRIRRECSDAKMLPNEPATPSCLSIFAICFGDRPAH